MMKVEPFYRAASVKFCNNAKIPIDKHAQFPYNNHVIVKEDINMHKTIETYTTTTTTKAIFNGSTYNVELSLKEVNGEVIVSEILFDDIPTGFDKSKIENQYLGDIECYITFPELDENKLAWEYESTEFFYDEDYEYELSVGK